MQLRKAPVKDLFVGIFFSIKDSFTDLKKVSNKLWKALYRLLVTIFLLLTRVLMLLLLPISFPIVRHMVYKSKINNLKGWNKTFQREWRYQRRHNKRNTYGHPYSELVDLINQNKESFGLITNDNKQEKHEG
ncbi:hypothetical protein OTK49_02500 [Vibrio coralliirubri]|uniref:hypothetical protein n=1 Tax=Vibrio coralliirubri TaxID=1516159 RepID=UPI002283683A|nr:hypothetical protein [Vibrio coralliirubri]MCY9861387.1 hypothetical protein [Vibrio coralliirubri]